MGWTRAESDIMSWLVITGLEDASHFSHYFEYKGEQHEVWLHDWFFVGSRARHEERSQRTH